MSVFDHREFDQHESIHHFHHKATGLEAVVAIHSTVLGPAAGGCRRWVYTSDADALTDALRLSRGMTYKNAVAGLPLGGGKAVILADEHAPKTPALLAAFGRAVDSLDGRYITAEDVGVTMDDLRHVARETSYVSGLARRWGGGGDPSPWTAHGVYLGLCTAVRACLSAESLEGLRVAVQGVGSVGLHLCRLLHEAGAILTVADVDEDRLRRVRAEIPVSEVPVDEVLYSEVDVLAPCALGGVLSAETIPHIRAGVIAGAANNQLATEADGARLAERGILYAPDYVINAGGIINVAREYFGQSTENQVRADIGRIPERLEAILAEADTTGKSTNQVADALARRIVAEAATGSRTAAAI